ncbi:histidine phosphatase family protein [Bacillus sp. FJAT-42376]|uniref:histidine phosphatase family protein n=1 Tax=Bacillus sp. FJAT-42376 TaxID=2014076 RepID=UPI000F4E05E2|nr:histidine phosphatase family protein [Bacillus sp. FJAT-42376]AZB42681.1 histidine phosphatase family protein [Bacillus sp. FJAT-42376]
MDGTVAIALFRHGMTEKNSRHVYSGWTDDPLSDEGKALLSPVKGFDPVLLFTSGMLRTDQTADLLFPDVPKTAVPALKEIHFGRWEGLSYRDLKEDRDYALWLSDMDQHAPPDGESLTAFKERVMDGWGMIRDRILRSHAPSAAVICHGGTIRQLMTEWSGDARGFWEWKAEPGAGFIMIFTLEALRRGEPCISFQEVPLTAKPNG